MIRSAIDRGITFMDNCWDYNDGVSEVRMGKALQDGYRNKVFLMTKIDGRTKASAAQQIDESLQRLQTDHVDLMQFHEVIRLEDPDRIFAEGGAMEAMLEAKKAGKVRYIGFTGHKDPYVHLRMLDHARKHDFHFDTVQMPLNVMDAHFRSFTREVLPALTREGIGGAGDEVFRRPFYSRQQHGQADRGTALLPQPAGERADHGDRQPADSGPGAGSGADLQASVFRRGGQHSGAHQAGGTRRQVRTLQDKSPLRRDGA